MSNDVKITNGLYINRSKSDKIHELTMLYLKNQNISNLSISELAQKYSDIEEEFDNAFKEQRQSRNTYV